MGFEEPYVFDPSLEAILKEIFIIEDKYIDVNVPTFIVSPRMLLEPIDLKERFRRVADKFKERGYLPFLRKTKDGRLVVRVFQRRAVKRRGPLLNIALFVATLGTIFLDGYIRCSSPILRSLMPNASVLQQAAVFTACLMAIFLLHEMGHKVTAMKKNIDASLPYFIPAPPGFGGTFGAVITQREPPTNRDDLFDLGFSGPFVGFIVTVVVAALGLYMSFVVPIEFVMRWSQYVRFIPVPLLIRILANLIRPRPPGYVLLMHPVAFAAWVGALVTFLNLLPTWQLDGGHIARAMFGERGHKISSIVGVLILFLSGFVAMALLVLIMMLISGPHGGPLDDVSPLSRSRKLVLYPLSIAALVLCAVFMIPF